MDLGTKSVIPRPSFPRVVFLRYHGYSKYFPLWAIARYRNLKEGNPQPVRMGM